MFLSMLPIALAQQRQVLEEAKTLEPQMALLLLLLVAAYVYTKKGGKIGNKSNKKKI